MNSQKTGKGNYCNVDIVSSPEPKVSPSTSPLKLPGQTFSYFTYSIYRWRNKYLCFLFLWLPWQLEVTIDLYGEKVEIGIFRCQAGDI